MASKQNIGFVVGAALLSLTGYTSANAALVSVETEMFANGVSVLTGSDSEALEAFSAISNEDGRATARSTANGNLTVNASVGQTAVAAMMMSLPEPTGEASAIAAARWEDTVTNNTNTQVGYKWAFRVENPRLGNGGHADDYAALAINILVNGVAVWEAFASLDNCVLTTSNMSLTQWDPCNATGPSFDVVADLGVFAHGSVFDVAYEMIAYVDTGDTESVNSWGTFAAIGDPFSISGEGFGQIIATPLSAVSEPGTMGLLGMALLGIGYMRRKQQIS